MGGTMLAGTPADLAKLIADETEKWGKVVEFAGAKPDWRGCISATTVSAVQERNELSVSKLITSKGDDGWQDFQLIHHLFGFLARLVLFARGHGFLELRQSRRRKLSAA
jgi:hypothetical protein